MSEKYTNEELARVIENEGLGDTVQSYTSSEKCADPETAKLFKSATDAMNALDEHMESYYEEY